MWYENTTIKIPTSTIYSYEVEMDGKTITIESMSKSRIYIHYKARKKYPNAKYIRVVSRKRILTKGSFTDVDY